MNQIDDPVAFVQKWAGGNTASPESNRDLARAVQAVYDTPQGQTVIEAIVNMRLIPSADPEPHITYYNEGQRAVAIWLGGLLEQDLRIPEQEEAETQNPEGD